MRNPIAKKTIVAVLSTIFMLLLCATATYAIVIFSFRVNGTTGIGTDEIDNDALISMTADTESFSFTSAGERKEISLSVSNTSDANVTYSYGLSVESSAISSAELPAVTSAVLVYYDNKFLGTLAGLCKDGEYIIDDKAFVKEKSTKIDLHKLVFELHIAASGEYLNKNITVNIATYIKNADYGKYIFISDETDFGRAVEDINSGALTDKQTLVIVGDLTLTQNYEIKKATVIDLYGHEIIFNGNVTLTGEGAYELYSSRTVSYSALTESAGKIILNNGSAILEISDMFNYVGDTRTNVAEIYSQEKINAVAYDSALANELIKQQFEKNTGYGIPGGESVSLLGNYLCYSDSVTVSGEGNYVYSDGLLQANSSEFSSVESINIGGLSVEFNIIGNEDDAVFYSLLTNELKHIPDSITADATVCDIFLPKAIESKNISIQWRSSDENVISSNGKLADSLAENTPVKLYADINFNGKTYTKIFNFRISSQTKETKFHYLVAQLSPITLKNVYKDGNKDVAYVYLPIVTENGTQYDYRTDYSSPANEPTLNWDAFKDIGLVNLSYSVLNAYNFISLDNSDGCQAVYLNSATFYTFAQLNMIGDFGGGEVYESTVNVIIELGANAELYELTFKHVEKSLSDVDILQNMLDTRVKYGMYNERGDFYLGSKYQTVNISYSKVDGYDAVEKIELEGDAYHVYINADYFKSTQAAVAVKVKVNIDGDAFGSERILYFKTPAVIKPDVYGFGNESVFHSVKYQLLQQLPEYERLEESERSQDGEDPEKTERAERLSKLPPFSADTVYDTGFVESNGLVTDLTSEYILQADIVRCKELYFSLAQTKTGTSNDTAYDMVRVLQWATSDKKTALGDIEFLSGTPVVLQTYESVVSDGMEYFSSDEQNVLKVYYQSVFSTYNGAEWSDDVWNEFMSDVFVKTGGAIIFDASNLGSQMKTYLTTGNGLSGGAVRYDGGARSFGSSYYFKYTEILSWADNSVEITGGQPWGTINSICGTTAASLGTPPGMDNVMYNAYIRSNVSYTIDMSDGSRITVSIGTSGSFNNFISRSDNGTPIVEIKEDQTEYISKDEELFIKLFWYMTLQNESDAKALCDVFNSCMMNPIYLGSDTVSHILRNIYSLVEIDGFVSEFTEFETTDGAKIHSPNITGADNAFNAISLITELKGFGLYGELKNGEDCTTADLPVESGGDGALPRTEGEKDDIQIGISAFSTTTALNGFYARLTNIKSSASGTAGTNLLTKLIMRNVANGYVVFTLDDTSRLTKIEYLDIAYNSGIENVNQLTYSTLNKIEYFDIGKCGQTYEFKNYIMSLVYKLASDPIIYYTDDGGLFRRYNPGTKIADEAVVLSYLKEINKIDSEYLQLCKTLYTDEGTAVDITWYIESGNMIYGPITNAGAPSDVTEVSSAEEMNKLMRNYFYCGTSFTGAYSDGTPLEFVAGTLYKLYYENGVYGFKAVISDVEKVTAIPDANASMFEGASASPSAWREKGEEQKQTQSVTLPNTSYRNTNSFDGNISLTGTTSYYYLSSQGTSGIKTCYGSYMYYIEREYLAVETEYTYYTDSGSMSTVKYYYNIADGATVGEVSKVTHMYTSDAKYITYTVREYRTCRFYYYKSSWINTYTRINSTADNDTIVLSTSRNGSSSYKTITIRENGEYYPVDEDGKTTLRYYLGSTLLTESTPSNLNNGLTEAETVLTESYSSEFTSVAAGYRNEVVNYCTYVNLINEADECNGEYAYAEERTLYRYTGTTGSSVFYEEGVEVAASYTLNEYYGLQYNVESDPTAYEFTSVAVTSSTGTTMEAIIAEANSHISDGTLGNYYGEYYYYTGGNVDYISHSYVQNGVYKIVWNETRTALVFEYIGLCESTTSASALLDWQSNATEADVGKIYYSSDANVNLTYGGANLFYELTYNEATGSYYMKRFGALRTNDSDNDESSNMINPPSSADGTLSGTASKIDNEKLYNNVGGAGGTGGSAEAIIIARITVNVNGESVAYERKFAVTVEG